MNTSILIIDPVIDVSDPLCEFLQEVGYELVCFKDRKALVQSLSRLNPEIILIDPHLEDVTSPTLFFRELRETFQHSAFILMSALPVPELMLSAINLGVEHFFEKPVAAEMILDCIQAVVAARQKQEALVQSEKHYKAIVQTAPDLLLLINRNGTIQEINHSFLGRSAGDWIGENLAETLTDDTAGYFLTALDGIIQTGHSVHCDIAIAEGNVGALRWFEARMAPIEQAGPVSMISVMMRDITERIHDLKEIEQQHHAIQTLFEMGQQVSSTLDLNEIFDLAFYKIQEAMACNSYFLASFDPVTKLIRAEYSRHEGQFVDVSVYPPLPLNPDGKGTQSRVILSGEAMILNDYQATLKTSKTKHVIAEDGGIIEEEEVPEDGDVMRSAIIIPIKLEGQVVGVIQVFSIRKNEYDEMDLHFLEAVSSQVAVASNNAGLYRQVQAELNIREQAEKELEQAYNQTLMGWVHALEIREQETAGHSKRVTDLMMKLVDQYEFEERDRLQLWRGALLHDIGKLVIPADLLLKNGTLNEQEWAVMRQHGEYAYEWLSSIDYLREALDIPRYHHEKWNGKGYPIGLRGEEIPLSARMFAVIDVYDALINDRPYRKAWSEEAALEYIESEAGKHFDPEVVSKFLKMISTMGD